jgi:hypothetical protein
MLYKHLIGSFSFESRLRAIQRIFRTTLRA